MTADTFEALLGCAGLAHLPTYATRGNFIDEVLCGRRHRIAHGVWQPITSLEANDVIRDVLELCTELSLQLQDAALYERYRA